MGRLALVVMSFVVCGAGCHCRQYAVESVTRDSQGTIWVSGTDGFAGHFSPDGFTRADYRCGRREFRGAYHTYMDMPASQFGRYRGEPYLFTRAGEVSRWSGGEWQELNATLPLTFGDYTQVNFVFEAPDGRLLIQIHSETLVWATPEQLASGQFERETTPTFFTSLAFVGDVLYGLGHDDGGNTPVLRRRDGPGEWPVVAPLPQDVHVDSFHGVIAWGTGEPAVVAPRGVLLSSDGELTLVTTEDLLRRAGRDIPESVRHIHVARLVRIAGGRALLQLRGGGLDSGLLASIDEQAVGHWRCQLPPLVGGVAANSRTWMVTRRGAIYELGDGECPQVHPPLLDEE